MAGKTYNISISTGNTPLVKNVALLAAGAVAASVFAALRRRLAPRGGVAGAAKAGAADANRSTTSSAGGGAGAYETRKAVDEYLQFHYGRAEELLPYSNGPKVGSRGGRGGTGAGRLAQQRHGRAQGGAAAVPRHGAMRQLCPAALAPAKGPSWQRPGLLPLLLALLFPPQPQCRPPAVNGFAHLFGCGRQSSAVRPLFAALQEALDFAARLAALCEQHCTALQDFTGEQPDTIALDVGCAVVSGRHGPALGWAYRRRACVGGEGCMHRGAEVETRQSQPRKRTPQSHPGKRKSRGPAATQ